MIARWKSECLNIGRCAVDDRPHTTTAKADVVAAVFQGVLPDEADNVDIELSGDEEHFLLHPSRWDTTHKAAIRFNTVTVSTEYHVDHVVR